MENKKSVITKKECTKRIRKLLNKRNYTKNDSYYLEFYVNIYLLLYKKRKLAQIYIRKHHTSFSSTKMIKILKKSYPYFIYKKESFGDRFILYEPKYNIQKMNKSFTKKYAKDLGSFYVCAGDLKKIYKKYKYFLRPVIHVAYENKYQKEIKFELFSQICPPLVCAKNIKLFHKIRKSFQSVLQKIDPNITLRLVIQS